MTLVNWVKPPILQFVCHTPSHICSFACSQYNCMHTHTHMCMHADKRTSARGARPKPPIEYTEQQGIAAAALSSSAWYATTLRVLHELR
jgi:hypothetical protein